MSSTAKARRSKRKAKNWYEERGWIIDDVEKTARYEKNKDLFNLFDLVAIKGRKILLIQVKTNRPARQKEYKEWAAEHASDSIGCVVWTWYDHKGPRIQDYRPSGKIKEEDHRD